tara:strand:- start:112 stop:495 length:384 start_codon:yes stop_codon:yes gene_type:complete
MKEHKCDKLGDRRDGWINCSECGVTDWDGLYKYKFETVEVINLITQNVELCDRIVKEEKTHLLKVHSSSKLIRNLLDINIEIDVITFHIESLSKKNRMLLFIQSHDFIFNTTWVETMRSMRRRGYEV